jgi:hypothetical protein
MRAAAAFAGACAVGILVWWLVLFLSPGWRHAFVPEGSWPAFRIVVVPDMLLALATAIVAVQLRRGHVPVLLATVLGGWVYATAFAVAWAIDAGAPASGPLLMMAALAGFLLVWHAVVPSGEAGRR